MTELQARRKIARLMIQADDRPFLRELIAMALYRLNRGELPFAFPEATA